MIVIAAPRDGFGFGRGYGPEEARTADRCIDDSRGGDFSRRGAAARWWRWRRRWRPKRRTCRTITRSRRPQSSSACWWTVQRGALLRRGLLSGVRLSTLLRVAVLSGLLSVLLSRVLSLLLPWLQHRVRIRIPVRLFLLLLRLSIRVPVWESLPLCLSIPKRWIRISGGIVVFPLSAA